VLGDGIMALFGARSENRERRSRPRTTGEPATVSRLTKHLETSLVKARRPESLLERPAELSILIN
jgi:hypothetical protein